MAKEYVTHAQKLRDLRDGQEITFFVQDLTPGPRKYDGQIVKAVIYSSKDKLPDGDVLWIRSSLGALQPKPWAMKIVERLGETLPGRPGQLL